MTANLVKPRTELRPELVGLPLPWSLLDKQEFDEASEKHPRTEETALEALDILVRTMHAAVKDAQEEPPEIPMDVPWGLTVRAFLGPIRRVDEYHRDLFDKVFEMGMGRRGTRHEVDSLAADWIRGLGPMIFHRAVEWLLPSLREDPQSTVARAYRALVRDRWKSVLERNASTLISHLCLVRCPETEELLRDIEGDPDATEELKRAVMGVRSEWECDDYYAANPHIPRY